MRFHMTLNYNIKLWSLSQGQVAFFLSSVVSLLTLKTLTPYPEHTPWSPRAPFLRVPLQRLQAGGSSGRGGRDAGERGAECLAGGGGSHAPKPAPTGSLGPAARLAAATSASRLGRTSFRAPQARFAGDAPPLPPAADGAGDDAVAMGTER